MTHQGDAMYNSQNVIGKTNMRKLVEVNPCATNSLFHKFLQKFRNWILEVHNFFVFLCENGADNRDICVDL